ncbi:hypothetical protein D9619_005151 [Psilocybe cf. subviscida]|uniref:Fungal-type protein kinase domain-containing protein n=1 Tax=Psilocybe cf. subviscida TaxID=2480587 RepID=A0A8H5F8D1_9AGAR|nr:hypothetical protein D9619_005151 [Psilocybe cf. subviscida]
MNTGGAVNGHSIFSASTKLYAPNSSQSPPLKTRFSSTASTPIKIKDDLAALLKDELGKSIIQDVPGMLEHMFSDNSLPVSVENVVAQLGESGKLLDTDNGYSWSRNMDILAETTDRSTGKQEAAAKAFLNEICAFLIMVERTDGTKRPNTEKARTWTTVTQAKPLSVGPADVKPDLCLSTVKDSDMDWKHVLATIQLKSSASSAKVYHALQQVTGDAFMALSAQDTRRFYVGVTINGFDVRVSKLIALECFVRLLIGLTLGSTKLIGYDSTITEQGGIRCVTVEGGVYRLIRLVSRSRSIGGRGTTRWRAVLDSDPNGKLYAIRDSWTDTSRLPEASLLRAVEGIKEVPQLIGSEKVDNNDGRDITESIRSVVDKDLIEGIATRELWRIVCTPFAEELCNFSSKRELLSVVGIDAINAHRDMVTLKKILHRDISEVNIMLYHPLTQHSDNDSGITAVKWLLLDLDYAIYFTDNSWVLAVGHRTNRGHAPYHDLESFFYVLVWIYINYAGPKIAPRQDIDLGTLNWTAVGGWINYTDLAAFKYAAFTAEDVFEENVIPLVKPYFSDLHDCLTDLRNIFYLKKKPTRDDMTKILMKHLKSLPETQYWSPEQELA